jgi:hypothetical protein
VISKFFGIFSCCSVDPEHCAGWLNTGYSFRIGSCPLNWRVHRLSYSWDEFNKVSTLNLFLDLWEQGNVEFWASNTDTGSFRAITKVTSRLQALSKCCVISSTTSVGPKPISCCPASSVSFVNDKRSSRLVSDWTKLINQILAHRVTCLPVNRFNDDSSDWVSASLLFNLGSNLVESLAVVGRRCRVFKWGPAQAQGHSRMSKLLHSNTVSVVCTSETENSQIASVAPTHLKRV